MQKDTTVGTRKYDPFKPTQLARDHLTRLLGVALDAARGAEGWRVDRPTIAFAEGRGHLPPEDDPRRFVWVFVLGYHLGASYQGGIGIEALENAVRAAHARGLDGGQQVDAVPFAKGFKCGQLAVWTYENPGAVPDPTAVVAPWDSTPTGLTVQ